MCQECVKYQQDEMCTSECSPDTYYPDEKQHKCIRCYSECNGCYGSQWNQCKSCKNYRIYLDVPNGDPVNNSTKFNCTATCPPEYPHKVFPQGSEVPYCAISNPQQEAAIEAQVGVILPSIVVPFVIIFFVLAGYMLYKQRKNKSKSDTVKMTTQIFEDNEPLNHKPSNIKPNTAKLRFVKDDEIHKGKVLGHGAFGTVYGGLWVPRGENVKIPVAIKELRDGLGVRPSEIIEEAGIMASVKHPHILQLLAVCLASDIMLVTRIMPLGCLRDYVQQNKDRINSKTLLSWCTQIAKGKEPI